MQLWNPPQQDQGLLLLMHRVQRKAPVVLSSAGPEADINIPGVQTNIQKAIIKVEKIRKSVYDIRYSLTTKINNIEKEITRVIKEASAYIASLLRTVYGFMEKQLLNGLTGIINKTWWYCIKSSN